MRYSSLIREGQLAAQPYVVTFNIPEIGINNERVEVTAIPPVISDDLYERVKERIAKNRKNRVQHHTYTLRGYLFCASCGYALQGSTTSLKISDDILSDPAENDATFYTN